MSTVSIILTVFNKEHLIKDVFESIIRNINKSITKEIIIIVDGCTDRTEEIVDNLILEYKSQIKIIKEIANNVFEVKANNIGLKLSECTYSCIIQDDMVITHKHFDHKLLYPFYSIPNVFAVTGRTAHNDMVVKKNWFKKRLVFADIAGRENNLGENNFAIRDVVNRGPLMINNEKLRQLNFLDEKFAPLDLDDHDLCLKAYLKYNWLCGSFVVHYESDPEWGSTRSNKKSSKIWNKSHKKNEQIIIKRYENQLKFKHNQDLIIDYNPDYIYS
jgi:glycosyltransferase involved in cell wall biosynthesis